MSSQWLKASRICVAVFASARCSADSVWSENTTPQPKVSPARLRSSTVTSCEGLIFFISKARYKPAGPPPMQVMRMCLSPMFDASL